MRKQFPQIFPKTLNQSFEKCETPFITIHTFSLGAAVTGCLENKYFNLVSLGFYIGKQKDLFVQASIILPTRATLPFYDHTKMKRKKEKKTSQHPHHFFSAISRIQSRPGARVHFMKLNPSPVHFKQGHTHTHKKGKGCPPVQCEGSLNANGAQQRREGAVWLQRDAEDMARLMRGFSDLHFCHLSKR